MKVIKLTHSHMLGKYHFTHGFRFASYCEEVEQVKGILGKMYGDPWNQWWGHFGTGDKFRWGYYWSKKNKLGNRIYFIGVKDQADITAVLLKME